MVKRNLRILGLVLPLAIGGAGQSFADPVPCGDPNTTPGSVFCDWKEYPVTNNGPLARMWTAVGECPTRSVMVMIGDASNHDLNTTWEFDGSGWNAVSMPSPSQRYGHAVAYLNYNSSDTLVLYGGRSNTNGSLLNDTWLYDCATSTWSELSGVSTSNHAGDRKHHRMAYDSVNNKVVVYGGDVQTGYGTTYYLDLASSPIRWRRVTFSAGTEPPNRLMHGMVYLPVPENKFLVFGGKFDSVTLLNDTWKLNIGYIPPTPFSTAAPGTWTPVSTTGAIEPRYDFGMAYDNGRELVVLFGGVVDIAVPPAEPVERVTHATWEFDPATSTWRYIPLSTPWGRQSHAMAYSQALEGVFMFGGSAPVNGEFAWPYSKFDTWLFGRRTYSCTTGSATGYSTRVFTPHCTDNVSNRTEDPMYDSALVGLHIGANDKFYLSGEPDDFTPLAGDEAIKINANQADPTHTGYDPEAPPPDPLPPGWPEGYPIEQVIIPKLSENVVPLLVSDTSNLFELYDEEPGAPDTPDVFGNSPTYLVHDCQIQLEMHNDAVPPEDSISLAVNPLIRFVSREEVTRQTFVSPWVHGIIGRLSDLRANQGFLDGSGSPAYQCWSGTDNIVYQGGNGGNFCFEQPPPPGEGYYYLIHGLSSCVSAGYGDSSLTPDPRDALMDGIFFNCPDPGPCPP